MTERLRGSAAVKQRDRRLAAEQYLCRDCRAEGRTTIADVVDHIIPLVKGGTDDDANTRPLCNEHHRKRTAEQFGHRETVPKGPRTRYDARGWPIWPRGAVQKS